jgi:hypothetical protein
MINNKEFDLTNKFDKFIFGLIESRINGDWTPYETGDDIEYRFELNDEEEVEWMDLDFSINSLTEYIGDGINYNGCEVTMENYTMVVNEIFGDY